MKKMKNKKGFTLVELLAVIAILAILVIIALPNILSMFRNAKKSSFETELKTIYKAAQQSWISDSINSTADTITYARTVSGNCTKYLELNGRSEIYYIITIDKTGNVIEYAATDNTYKYEYSGDGLKIENITSAITLESSEDYIAITCDGVSSSTSGSSSNEYYVVSTTEMEIGSTIPDGVNVRSTAALAMADWVDIAGSTKPFYLKQKLNSSEEIEESYVCFEINDTDYCLKGYDRSAFLDNAKIIYDAFEGAGCYSDGTQITATYDSTYSPSPTSSFACSGGGLHASAYSYGDVDAGDGRYTCYVDDDGTSSCI